jgi:hypothetical protein
MKPSNDDTREYFRTQDGFLVMTGDPDMVWHFVAYCIGEVRGLGALVVPGGSTKSPIEVMTEHYDITVDEPSGRGKMARDYSQYLKSTYQHVSEVPDIDKLLVPYNNTTLYFGSYTATYHSLTKESA